MTFLCRHRDSRNHRSSAGTTGPSVTMLTIRVAMAAAAIVGVAYVAIAFAVVMTVSANMTSDVDRQLQRALDGVAGPGGTDQGGPGGPLGPGFDPSHQDPRGLLVLLWKVNSDGTATSLGPTNGLLQVNLSPTDYNMTTPATISIGGASYRILSRTTSTGHYVAAQSMDAVSSSVSTMIVSEIGIGCALLIVVFFGALAIGWRVASPIERARRRQLEFTADASHELRTPLSVIEAHTSLALARPRDKTRDAAAFGRIDGELKRTRRLVEDMLWLARFDSSAAAPDSEPVDLTVLAAQTADRFHAVAESRGQTISVLPADVDGAIVTAPPEWLDRLLGVLLDNACKYSPQGGRIEVLVASEGRRVRLSVDDSGPGIPPEERDRVFDRFHRASDTGGGAGLGLAIANAIVGATGGRWSVGESELGGARLSVSWPRVMAGGRHEAPR